MRRIVWVVVVSIAAATTWVVALARRNGPQIYATSFPDHLRAASLAITVAVCAGGVAWLTSRRSRSWMDVALAGAAGFAVAIGAARRPDLPNWVTVVVDAWWLGGAALFLGVISRGISDRDTRAMRHVLIAAVAIATSGVAVACLDRGAGLGSTIGALPSTDVPSSARIALAIHVVLLGLSGLWVTLRSTARRSHRVAVVGGVWLLATTVEHGLPLFSLSTFRDLAADTYKPWAMVVSVYVPLVAAGAVLAVIGWSLAVRPSGVAPPIGRLVLREQDPVQMLRDDMATWLGDPTLELAFADPAGGWVSTSGVVSADVTRYDRATTVLTRDDSEVGMLIHDVAVASAPEALATASALAGLALDANQLMAVSEGRLADAHRTSARLLHADSTTRSEVLAVVEEGPLNRLRKSADAIRYGAPLTDVLPELRLATSEVRALSHGILPPELTTEGLRAALPTHRGVPQRRLPPAVEITAYLLARADAGAEFDDRGTTLTVIRGAAPLSRSILDRVAVLGGTVDGDHIDLPI